jgi:DNA repair protein RadC
LKYDEFSIPWQVNDSAAAKMMQAGGSALTNSELLSVAVGITTDASKQLLGLAGNNLHSLAKMPLSELSSVFGISTGKAIQVFAIFEIGRRRNSTPVSTPVKIRCSQDAFGIINGILSDLTHEEFWIILCSRSNSVITSVKISQGGISGTVTDVRLILNAAIEKLASGLILCHNHPSQNLSPSDADIKITKKIKDAAALLDITLLDHIIVSSQGYLSMADDNLMPI